MLLHHYVTTYLSERPGLSGDYRALMEATARKLCAWTGRQLVLEDVDRAMLAGWAEALRGELAPATINGRLAMVRRLLLAAFDDGYLPTPPKRVRRLAEFHAPPEAWDLSEVRRLFAHLLTLPGMVGSLPASDWWTSLCLVCYWTGCRISALLAAAACDYSPGEGLTVRRQKNGRSQFYRLPASCCEAVERILPDSGPIWSWPLHRRTLWLHMRRYVEDAGLPCPRTHGQLFQRIRRTNASYCAAEDPAIAQRQLDHASYATTLAGYVDPRIARQRSAADVLPDPLLPDGRPHLRIFG